MADYSSMFLAEELRLDGSNFAEWYMRLREVLHTNDELYVLDEPLEECPDVSANYEEYMELSPIVEMARQTCHHLGRAGSRPPRFLWRDVPLVHLPVTGRRA